MQHLSTSSLYRRLFPSGLNPHLSIYVRPPKAFSNSRINISSVTAPPRDLLTYTSCTSLWLAQPSIVSVLCSGLVWSNSKVFDILAWFTSCADWLAPQYCHTLLYDSWIYYTSFLLLFDYVCFFWGHLRGSLLVASGWVNEEVEDITWFAEKSAFEPEDDIDIDTADGTCAALDAPDQWIGWQEGSKRMGKGRGHDHDQLPTLHTTNNSTTYRVLSCFHFHVGNCSFVLYSPYSCSDGVARSLGS